ncbi:MAG: response regulator transcription factor [Elusimicrobia bacterium]|nr:response regulator transcription factor [Elusimicrobiota bacterium]
MPRILIVEDDGDLQQILSLAFNREGFETHYAFNGKEGYEKILALQPDIILLDLMLPILNGVEVIKLVTSNISVREIPIIVMTAHGDKADMLEQSIRAHGVREYVRKPFEIKALVGLVRRLIAQYPRVAAPQSEVAKGEVRLDTRFRTVWISGQAVATLAPTRASVLKMLLEAKGPVKREKLLQAVWGSNEHVSALEKTIQRLREDLGPEGGKRIQTTEDGYELVG